MSCEHLICAQCSSPVIEARCPACRAARAQVHRHLPGLNRQLMAAALIAVLLVVLALHMIR